MNNRIETTDKTILIDNDTTNDTTNDNIKTLKNISIKERPFSPTSPSTFEKGVYVEINTNPNRENDWSLVTIDFEN